jgi:hypothetical protein
MREKTTKFFSYMSRITFKEAPTSNSPATTGRRLQPPSFSGYNLREAPTPQFSGYNQKEATTPYVLYNRKVATTTYPCPVQPP